MTEPAAVRYPGTPAHQALLRAIVAAYEANPRVRAVIVFGSLGRGNWDAWSDIDLDVLQDDLDTLSVGRLQLSQSQQVVLAGVRQHLASRILSQT